MLLRTEHSFESEVGEEPDEVPFKGIYDGISFAHGLTGFLYRKDNDFL